MDSMGNMRNTESNVIDFLSLKKAKEDEVKQEVDENAPFAESTAELVAEFLYFSRNKPDILDMFCDILYDSLKDGAEEAMYQMVERIRKTVDFQTRHRRKKPEVAKMPRRQREQRRRIRRTRNRK